MVRMRVGIQVLRVVTELLRIPMDGERGTKVLVIRRCLLNSLLLLPKKQQKQISNPFNQRERGRSAHFSGAAFGQ